MISYHWAEQLHLNGFKFPNSFIFWINDTGSKMPVCRSEHSGIQYCEMYDAPDATELMRLLPEYIKNGKVEPRLEITLGKEIGKTFFSVGYAHRNPGDDYSTFVIDTGMEPDSPFENALAEMLIKLKERNEQSKRTS